MFCESIGVPKGELGGLEPPPHWRGKFFVGILITQNTATYSIFNQKYYWPRPITQWGGMGHLTSLGASPHAEILGTPLCGSDSFFGAIAYVLCYCVIRIHFNIICQNFYTAFNVKDLLLYIHPKQIMSSLHAIGFWLLSKHSVSPCFGTLCECQTKQMPKRS